MKAIVIHGYGGPEILKYQDYPDPVPGPGEVLIKVAAASVNPFDFKIRSGALKDFIPTTFPAILGIDLSGEVESVGSGVTEFAMGDKVFACAPHTYAERCVVKAGLLAKIPEGADLVETAALPTVTITGAQLASLALGNRPNAILLVTGAVGNVGRSAVYTGKSRGATVIAGVLKRQVARAQDIGADKVIALDDPDAVESLGPIDAIADTVGGDTADAMIKKVKAGGIFASVLGPPSTASLYPTVLVHPMEMAPDPALLMQMAAAMQKRAFTIPLGQKFALADAAEAHAAAEKGSAGKILLLP
jgi:NADPH:quinone reductase-like Zn-dependent oxidoreductase